jgi:hypothetical protein
MSFAPPTLAAHSDIVALSWSLKSWFQDAEKVSEETFSLSCGLGRIDQLNETFVTRNP